MEDFDESAAGGSRLNADLAELKRSHGCDHLLLEASFPPEYPRRGYPDTPPLFSSA